MFILNGNADRILKTLRSCGLTENESKVYFTLLLTERSKIGDISRKSAVPQSKVYWVVESLADKGLLSLYGDRPKFAETKSLEPYIKSAMREKQREMSELADAGQLIQDTVYKLRPMTVKYKDKYRVFEPKYLKRRRRLTRISFQNGLQS